jgi:predicted aspartyl protease
MGLTVLEAAIANPAKPDVKRSLEFLIDSGAIYSVAPATVLDDLGIKPSAEQSFRLADGSRISRRKGVAVFSYGEHIGVADVIFGEEGDSTILGVFTLEALGLTLDPFKRELRPLPMILAGSCPHEV